MNMFSLNIELNLCSRKAIKLSQELFLGLESLLEDSLLLLWNDRRQ